MIMKKTLILLPLVAIFVTGCTSSGRKSRRSGDDDQSYVPPEPGPGEARSFQPDDFYAQHYTNKKDCFGNSVNDYYLYNLFGDELVDSIHNYCIDQHKTYLLYTVSANYAQYFKETDKNPNTGKTIQFYTGKELSGGSGTREHVWACANSSDLWYRSSSFYEHKIDDHDYWGGGSDIFNLHPCNGTVNGDRGNARFTVFAEQDRGSLKESSDGGPYSLLINGAGNLCEPVKEFRGNIARIVMYMWCHYKIGERNAYYPKDYSSRKPVYRLEDAVASSSSHSPNMCGSLTLDSIIGFNTNEKIYAALKQWNEEDPVDDNEKYANDYIESKLQGNRNPFIDYPQLVDSVLDWLS